MLLVILVANGNIALAAWGSFIFAIIVAIYSILFTRKMMDLARKEMENMLVQDRH